MSKTPFFFRNADGTFTFIGYFRDEREAKDTRLVGDPDVVDSSFLYRTVSAANEALNSMPLPEGCTK